MNKFYVCFFLLLIGCYRVSDQIDPRVSYHIQEQHFDSLKSAFSTLNPEEKMSDWGKEYLIAHAFADELDLYRAVSTFKRASILLGHQSPERQLEIQYDIVFCFFLAKKYQEAIEAFEQSHLQHVDKTFPAYPDLLLVLYECYREIEDDTKRSRVLEMMDKSYPTTAENIKLSQALRQGNLSEICLFAEGFHGPSYLNDLVHHYTVGKKSVSLAQGLNALIPGAGYLYIGQKKSALTAFFLNGLFIAAAYQFFHRGNIAAGIITTSFEAGWYFGGIYGAGEEAKFYNERLYERNANMVLNEKKLFPVLMLEHAF